MRMNSPADRSGVQSLRGALNIEQIFTDLQTAYLFGSCGVQQLTRYLRALSKVDRRIHSDGAAFRRAQWRPHFKFKEAVSFKIPVETQAEIERLTNALSAAPEAEQCGWVKDRYGLSWQILPRKLPTPLGDANPRRAKRAFDSMMQLKRIDIAALEWGAEGLVSPPTVRVI
jgi:hypothetical protein